VAAALQPGHKDLTFVTNSTNVALTLQENGWDRIVLSGGMFRTPSDALVGPFADRTLRTLNADVLFLGVHGVHPDAGLTTPNTAEAETDSRLVDAAQRVVVVADNSKLGVVALARIIPLVQGRRLHNRLERPAGDPQGDRALGPRGRRRGTLPALTQARTGLDHKRTLTSRRTLRKVPSRKDRRSRLRIRTGDRGFYPLAHLLHVP
jgi:hypothetical protein